MKAFILLLSAAFFFSSQGFSQDNVVAFSAYYRDPGTGQFLTQNFPPGAVPIKIKYNMEEYDEMDNFKPGPYITPVGFSALSEFTAPSSGIYHFEASISFFQSRFNNLVVGFCVNGRMRKAFSMSYQPLTRYYLLTGDTKLEKGDIVDVRLKHDGEVTIDSRAPALNNLSYNWFSGHKVN
ncbi:MAG: hypothetical protein ABIT05_15215 [Chitinophagaceae bacterium]